MRALGIDYGKRRIGIALTDPLRNFASPHGFLDAHPRARLRRRLEALIAEKAVDTLVLGDPLTMDGEVGSQAQRVRDFADWLRSWCALPVVLMDERLTTVMAERTLIEGDMRRADRKQRIDAVAAAILLQGWLESGSPG